MGMEKLIMHETRNSSPGSLLTGLGLCEYSHDTHYGTSWAATVMLKYAICNDSSYHVNS